MAQGFFPKRPMLKEVRLREMREIRKIGCYCLIQMRAEYMEYIGTWPAK